MSSHFAARLIVAGGAGFVQTRQVRGDACFAAGTKAEIVQIAGLCGRPDWCTCSAGGVINVTGASQVERAPGGVRQDIEKP